MRDNSQQNLMNKRKQNKDTGEPKYFRKKSLALDATYNDLPLKKGTKNKTFIDDMSLNQIVVGVNAHRFTIGELEYLVEVMAMRISVYMSNKFVCY